MEMSPKERNLELNLGKVCNNRCIFCLDRNAGKSARKWLPLERAIREIESARREGVESIGLLGGEPTAHPRILEIATAARDAGFTRIALASNGLKLADADFARRLINSGVTRITISIHGHNAAIEDFLSGRQGNFAKKTKAIANLLELRRQGHLKHNVSLNAVLNRYNFRKMPAFGAFFKKMGITDVRFNLIRTDSCMERGKEFTPTLSELAPWIFKTILANERLLRMEISFGDIPLCVYPAEVLLHPKLAGTYIGEIRDLDTACAVFLSPADFSVDAQRFRWSDKKRTMLKIRSRECRLCQAAAICEGLWRSYAQLYGTAELKTIDTIAWRGK